MEGGLPLVKISTVFQPSISLYYHLPRTSFQYAVNLVVQLYQPTHMPLHDTSYFMPSIWSCNFYSHALFSNECFYHRQSELSNALSLISSYSRNECRLRRQSELSITVICAFNAQYDPNFNVWGPKKVIYIFYYTRYLEYLSPSRSRPRFMLVLMLIRSRCN